MAQGLAQSTHELNMTSVITGHDIARICPKHVQQLQHRRSVRVRHLTD